MIDSRLTSSAYESFKTVGSLLLTNSDFRLFVNDVSTIGRQVLSDTAFSLSGAAEEAGKKLEISDEEAQKISGAGADSSETPTTNGLSSEAADAAKIIGNGVAEVGKDAVTSAQENFSGDQGETLLYRLQSTVKTLRQRTDYKESVSTLAQLIKRYAVIYSRAADSTLKTLEEDLGTNHELDQAVHNFWLLVSSFGDKQQWEQLEQDWKSVMAHTSKDPQFESFMGDFGDSVQTMLTDPDFFNNVDQRLGELKEKAAKLGDDSDFKTDLDRFLQQTQLTVKSIIEDDDVNGLVTTAGRIFHIVSPPSKIANPDLLTDAINTFLPMAIRLIQYIPIPRLEISVPEMDLLLENVVFEPGRNVNSTSFLPFKVNVTSRNDLEIRKAHSKKVVSKVSSLMTVSIAGLSIAAQDMGFWVRGHPGWFRFADEGIASFWLDERGIDISLDLEVGREKLEQILTLKAVRVHVHKLDYSLRQSKLSWFGWLFKPFLKHMIRRSLEKSIAENIAETLHSWNRELVFARERLRATRIADPQDIVTFVKAVMARLAPPEDPDVYTRFGVDAPSHGVFKNVYAPGSIVKVWHEEALQAEANIEEGDVRGSAWRNDIFDVTTIGG